MIQYGDDSFNLSSRLANELQFTRQPEAVRIVLECNDVEFFTTVVYPVNGNYTLYGFRDLIEDYFADKALVGAEFTITAWEEDSDNFERKTVRILNAKVVPDCDLDEDFGRENFLTTRSHYVIPRSGSVLLYFVCSETDDSDAPSIECVFMKGGKITKQSYTPYYTHKSGTWFQFVSFSPTLLTQSIKAQVGYDPGTLLSATVTSGMRSMTVYVTDKVPDLQFYFIGAFGYWESVYIWGTTTVKTTLDFKEAECNGTTKRYSRTVERVNEVETVPLSLEEADWMNEFLTSPNIKYQMNVSDVEQEVILDDIESEIPDDGKDTVKIKFSWRFANHGHYLNNYKRVNATFKDEYTTAFD